MKIHLFLSKHTQQSQTVLICKAQIVYIKEQISLHFRSVMEDRNTYIMLLQQEEIPLFPLPRLIKSNGMLEGDICLGLSTWYESHQIVLRAKPEIFLQSYNEGERIFICHQLYWIVSSQWRRAAGSRCWESYQKGSRCSGMHLCSGNWVSPP